MAHESSSRCSRNQVPLSISIDRFETIRYCANPAFRESLSRSIPSLVRLVCVESPSGGEGRKRTLIKER